MQKMPINVIISDVVLPDANEFELMAQIKKEYQNIIVIMTSRYTKETVKQLEIQQNSYRFIQKPISVNTLLTEVKAAISDGVDGIPKQSPLSR